MKQIKLTQNRVALVDNDDFDWLSQWNWHYLRKKTEKTGYARRSVRQNSQLTAFRMHTEIMRYHGKLQKSRSEVDHINGCGLDNRKENLRVSTRQENGSNRKKHTNNFSGYPGVSWNSRDKKWQVHIYINKKQTHLGYYENLKDAIATRQQAEIKYYREFRHNPTNVCPLGYTDECPECAARLKRLHNE